MLSISTNRNTASEHLKGFSVLTPNISDASPEGIYARAVCHVLLIGPWFQGN